MDKLLTGGPAFPCVSPVGHVYTGISLRDYFASDAMKGLVQDKTTSFDQVVKNAYIIADKMLRAGGHGE